MTNPIDALTTLEDSAYKPQVKSVPLGAGRLFQADTMANLFKLAEVFSKSALVRPHFRGPKGSEGHANTFLALSMALELQIPWMQALTHINVVKGNVGFSGQLYIALANNRAPIKGRIMYDEGGEGKDMYCCAWAIDKDSGEKVEFKLSVGEIMETEWYKRNPLWRTQTKLMLRYRTAAYLVRTNFPEAMIGIQQSEELVDVYGTDNEFEEPTIKAKLEAEETQEEGEDEPTSD